MKNKITEIQYGAIILSSFIGIGILSLPAETTKIAKQDAWIATILGAIFPFILLMIAVYIDNKMNHRKFCDVIKKLYGKYLSYLVIFVFLIPALFYQVSIITGYVRVLKQSISIFLPDVVMMSVAIILTLITSSRGLTIIGRLCEIILYFTIPLLILPVFFIREGNINNVMPILDNGINIIYAVPKSFFALQGAEISFLILSFISNRKKVRKISLYSVLIVALIYGITVFMVIYYIGWELTSKIRFPLLFLFELVSAAVLPDFKALFILIWSFSIFLSIAIEQFIFCYILSGFFNIQYKKAILILLPILTVTTYISVYSMEFRRNTLTKLTNIFPITLMTWIIVTFIITLMKTKDDIS